MLGVVQTAEGLPIYHEVFDGNQAEAPTLLPTFRKVLARFTHIKRLIVVADRGLLSLDNVDELAKISLPDGTPLEFILAVPGRRYGEFTELLAPIQVRASSATHELIEETRWQGWRLVVAHDPVRAKEKTQWRRERIATLQDKAQQWAGKLDGQDAGVKAKGRKLSDSGARARLDHEVCEAHLARIVKVDLKSDLFSYAVDEGALAQAEMMDGKLLLVSNVADLAERIRAHAMLCFMALIVYRVMRQRLKLAKSELSPERALAQLRRIQRHSVSINAAAPITGISTINTQQASVLAALKLKKPSQDVQLSLL